jgi:aminopeptidase-like protein
MADPAYSGLRADDGGLSMHRFVSELYAASADTEGDGLRRTLAMLQAHVPITLHEVQSGTEVFDWTIPPEWKLREAYIADASGNRVIDASGSPRRVVRYSAPVHARMPLTELRRHIYSVRERPDWMPHGDPPRLDAWGFYLSQEELLALPEGEYEVSIDSTLEPGHMTYGECLLRGRSLEEVLVSCHLGDPTCPNDNFSGIAVAAALAQRLLSRKTRYSYRFLFIPSTIGSIAWIVLNQARLFRIKHGLVLAQLGHAGEPAYKMSRRGDAEIDRAFTQVLKESRHKYKIEPFSPLGHDERQYCSPGVDLAVGRFMRQHPFAASHDDTAKSDLSCVDASSLDDSLAKLLAVVDVLEHNRCYLNQNPFCEPQLSKYGLAQFRVGASAAEHRRALLWVLNFSDGAHTLLDIVEHSNLSWKAVKHAAQALSARGLLKSADRSGALRKRRKPGALQLAAGPGSSR